jgi:hypothetical protein
MDALVQVCVAFGLREIEHVCLPIHFPRTIRFTVIESALHPKGSIEKSSSLKDGLPVESTEDAQHAPARKDSPEGTFTGRFSDRSQKDPGGSHGVTVIDKDVEIAECDDGHNGEGTLDPGQRHSPLGAP